jgi:trimeric autotransporter adhesin
MNVVRFQLLFFLLLYTPLALAVPGSFVYQGQIIKPNGHTLDANNVQFTVEIISPGAEQCILFRERHNVNMVGSNGIFALEVGDGVPVSSSFTTASSLAAALNNSAGTLTGLECASVGEYTPSMNDHRQLRITFDDGSGPNTLTQDHRILSVPYAQSAATLNGLEGADLLVQREEAGLVLNQDNLESVFTDTNYPELMALLNGTSSTYLSSMPAADFSMNSNRITDLDSPVDPNDATNKNYVDSTIGGLTADPSIATLSVAETGQVLTWNGTQWETSEIVMEDTTKLPLAGGTMTGAIDMGNQNITNANQISLNGDLNADGNATILGDALVSGGIGVATGINSDGDISIHDLQALQLGNDLYGSSNYVGFRAPTLIPVDVIWTLPGSDGNIGQVLSTNGLGELSWVDPVDIMGTPALGGLVDNADYIMIYDTSEGELRRATRAELVLTEAEVDAYVANNGYASDADLSALDGRVTTNEGNITSLDTRVGTAEGDITGLQADVAGVQTDVANLDTRVTAAEGEITTIDGRVTTNETDITNLTTRVTDAEGEITAIDGRVTTNETDISNLDTRVTANEGAVTALDGRMTTAEGNISTLQTQVGNLDTDLSAVQTDLAAAQTDITNLTTRVTDNEGDISTLQGQMTTANTNISDLDGRVTVNEGAITALDTNKVNRAGDTMSGNLTLADREVRFTSGGANFVGLRAPAGLSADQVWTLPGSDGSVGQVLETDGLGALRWRTLDAVGESNTASNIGTGGVGVFVDKDGVDLRFRNISAASNKVTVTANANNIDVDVDESNLDAGLIANTPAGDIEATDIQAAINELDTEKVAKSGDTMTGDLTLATNNALILGDSGANYVGFVAPATVSASQIWTLPVADGAANQVLQTNGLGVLSWVDQSEFTPTAGDYTASDITFDSSLLSVTSTDVQGAIGELDGRMVTAEGNITSIQGDVTTAQTDITNLTTRVTDAETDITAIDGRVSTNETDIAGLDTRVTANEGAITALDGRMTTAEGNISTLQTQVGNLNTDLSAVQTDLATAQTDITNLTTRVTDNEGDISTLQGQMTTANTNISDLDGRVTVNEGAITALDTNKVNRAGDTMSGNLTLADREVRFTNGGANFVGLRAPAGLSADQVWTLPAADGSVGQVLETDGLGALRWRTLDSVGESNTASNIGTGGVGVFVDKDGVDLRFRNISAASNKVTVTANANNIDVDVDESNLDAGLIANTPAGDIEATDIQAAINELDTEKVAKSGDTMTGDLTLATNNALILGDSGANYVGFVAPATVSASQIWTLPVADGAANQVLQTNGLGVLSWVDQAEFTPTAGDYTASDITFDSSLLSVTSTDVQGAIGELDGRMVTAEGNITSIQGDVTTAQTDITNLGTRVTATEGDITTLQGQITTANTNISDLDGRVTVNEGAITALDTNKVDRAGDTMSGNLTLADREVRFTSGGANFVGLRAPAGLSADQVWTLPNIDGTNGQVLQTNGAGILSWANPSDSAPITSIFTRTGEIVAQSGDYSASLITNSPEGNIAATDVQAALNELDDEKVSKAGDTITGALIINNSTTLNNNNEMRFSDTGVNFVALRAASGLSSNTIWTLPSSDGVPGQLLQTDGSGTLSWVTASSGDFLSDGSSPMTGQLLGVNGSPAAPSFSFTSDTNTGMYRSAEDNLSFSTGGSERIRINEVGRLGIGLASPTAKLHVFDSVSTGTSTALHLSSNTTSVGTTATGAIINANGTGVTGLDLNLTTSSGSNLTVMNLGNVISASTGGTRIISATDLDGGSGGVYGIYIGGTPTSGSNGPFELIHSASISGGTTAYGLNTGNISNSNSNGNAALVRAGTITGGSTSYGMVTGNISRASSTGESAAIKTGSISGGLGGYGLLTGNISRSSSTGEAAAVKTGDISGGSLVFAFKAGNLTTASSTANATGIDIGNISGGSQGFGLRLGNVSATSSSLGVAYGMRVGQVSGGTSGTAYGLYLDTLSGGTQYAIYSSDTDANSYIGGSLGLGIVNPTEKLDVAGTIISGPRGTASGDGGAIRLKELAANGNNYVGLRAPNSIAGNIIWTLPSSDGTANQVLQTNGSGILSWVDQAEFTPTAGDYTASDIAFDSSLLSLTSTDVQGAVGELDNRMVTAEGNITSVQGDVSTAQTDITNLGTRVTATEGNITTLQGQMTTANTNISDLDGRVTANEGAITDLDTNKVNRSGDTMSGDLTLAGREVRFTSGGANFVGLRAPAGLNASQVWTLPPVDGSSGQLLQTNGAGLLTWATPASGADNLGNHTATENLNMNDNNIVNLASGNAAAPGISFNGSPNTGLFSSGVNSLSLSTAGLEALTINPSGNVGIGTTNPNFKLQVEAGNLGLTGSDYPGILLQSNGGAGKNPWIVMVGDQVSAGATVAEVAFENRNSGSNEKVASIQALNGSANDAGGFVIQTRGSTDGSPQNRLLVDENGLVGIGTSSPDDKLVVDGTIRNLAAIDRTSTTNIDFSAGNIQYTTGNCDDFALLNVKSGGSYTFVVQGTDEATCSFTAFSDAGNTALTVHMPPDHGPTTDQTHTIYTAIVAGTHIYFAWTPGL